MLLQLALASGRVRQIAQAAPPSSAPAFVDSDAQFQIDNNGTANATNSLTTASGNTLVVCALGDVTTFAAPTDNKSNSFSLLRSSQYAGGQWAPFAMEIYGAANANGGSGHVVTLTKNTNPTAEITLITAAIAGTVIEDSSIVARASNESQVSASVTTSGAARLVAFWSGDAGVNSNPKTTAPVGAEWTMHESLFLNDTAYVQAAMATREVGAGTHTITWTQVNASQGAILALVAVKA